MANQPVVQTDLNDQTRLYTWTMGNADNGLPIAPGPIAGGTIVVQGTFGGATVVLQGSNDGGTTWIALKDAFNAAISIAAANGLQMLGTNLPLLLRPVSSGGAGTTLSVLLNISKSYF